MPRLHLLVTADDLGYSAERDAGILTSFQRGLVTGASLLVNGASAPGALAAAVAAGLPVGLHLNLTEGAPVSDAAAVASLLAPPARARFRGKHGLREALARGDVDPAHVAAEVAAQLARFVALHPARAPPAHADGHQHVHVLPAVARALARACAAHGVRATRLPRLHAAEELAVLPPARAAFYREVSAQCDAAAALYAAAGVRWPRGFVGYTTMGADCSAQAALRLLARVAAGGAAACGGGDGSSGGGGGDDGAGGGGEAPPLFVEWMTHPGHATRARPLDAAALAAGFVGGAGCSADEGPDAFAADPGREVELRVLCDAALGAGLDALGVQRASNADFLAVAER